MYQEKHINLALLDPNASAHNSFIIGKIAFGNLGNVLAVKGIFIPFFKIKFDISEIKMKEIGAAGNHSLAFISAVE